MRRALDPDPPAPALPRKRGRELAAVAEPPVHSSPPPLAGEVVGGGRL